MFSFTHIFINMNIKYITLLIALIGVVILYILSLYAQPPIIHLSELPDHEGKIITTQGTINKYHQTDYGNQIITIIDNGTKATVFASTPTDIQSGDVIQVTGSVEQYQDTWEIMVDDPKAIQILKKWDQSTTPLWEIAQNPTLYHDQNLNVTGYIDSIYESYLYFTDNENEHTILVILPQTNNITLHTGELVILKAQFNYDPTQLQYIFSITEPYHTIEPVSGDLSDA